MAITIATGIAELNAKLRALAGDKITKKYLRAALRKVAKPMARLAKQLAPVDSGALEESIRVKAIRRTRTGIGVRVTTSASDNEYSGETFYAPMQEFGTAKMAASPYLRPAFDQLREASIKSVADDMAAAIIAETR